MLGQVPARVLVALHALRLAAAQDLRDDGVAVEIERARDGKARLAVLAPAADDRRRAVAVVAHEARARHAQQPRDLLGHLLEHAARRRSAGHERGHSAQRRLLVGERALGRLALRQRRRRTRALGGDRGEHQRGERRDGDEQLRRQQAVGDRLAHERPVVLRRVPDRDRAHDEDRPPRPRAARSAAPTTAAPGRRCRGRRAAAAARPAPRAATSAIAPSTTSRRWMPRSPAVAHVRITGATTSTPARVAQRPRPEDAPELVGGDHVAQAQRERPERRADERRDERARDEGQHVRDPLELAAPAGEAPQQQRSDDDGDRVPDRLREHRAERRRVVAEEEVADDDRRPQPDPVEEQDRQAEARRAATAPPPRRRGRRARARCGRRGSTRAATTASAAT